MLNTRLERRDHTIKDMKKKQAETEKRLEFYLSKVFAEAES